MLHVDLGDCQVHVLVMKTVCYDRLMVGRVQLNGKVAPPASDLALSACALILSWGRLALTLASSSYNVH